MSRGAAIAFDSIAASVGWDRDIGAVRLIPGPPRIATQIPVSDIAAGAYAALALSAVDYAVTRGRGGFSPTVDIALAGVALAGNEYLTIDGEAPRTWDPLTGYYPTADGRHVYIHTNFRHHRDGLLALLGVGADRAEVAAALAARGAAEIEEAAQAKGLCAIMTRSRDAWEAHGQFAALSRMALIAIESVAAASEAAAPTPRPALTGGPLAGVRVLDLSRIIAGPMAGRALADLGADVMRISAPDLPFIGPLTIDTGFGKRAAHADLDTEGGRAALRRMIADADIVIDGFRPGALAAKGFSATDIAAINPSIAVVALSAFADVGPWGGRRGYDSYVQAAVGLTASKGDGPPVRLACQPLDYLTGCLCAFGAVRCLTDGLEAPGARQVELSLARTAMWLWEMYDRIGPDVDAPSCNFDLTEAEAAGWITCIEGDAGSIGALAPPYRMSDGPHEWRAAPRALGSDPPDWACFEQTPDS